MKLKKVVLIIFTLLLIACSSEAASQEMQKITDEDTNSGINAASAINNEVTHSIKENEFQQSPDYLAKKEGELSIDDSETAYEMCVIALTEYYKAVWNGQDIDLDTFIENQNLIQYMQEKIQSQNDVYGHFNDKVKDIKVDALEVKYTDDIEGGYLYLKLPVAIIWSVGSRGEATEFLIRNIHGKLVIVDWYTGTKDGYDFMVRGENLTIDNPNIWNDSESVKQIDSKTN